MQKNKSPRKNKQIMKALNLNILFFFFALSCVFIGCEADEFPIGNNDFVINDDSTNIFPIGKTIWLYNAEYEVNTIKSDSNSLVDFEITLFPSVLESGATYTGYDVNIMIYGNNIKTYTSNKGVKVTITDLGKQSDEGGYIAGKFEGSFFYVENARTVNVNIKGLFSTTKKQ